LAGLGFGVLGLGSGVWFFGYLVGVAEVEAGSLLFHLLPLHTGFRV